MQCSNLQHNKITTNFLNCKIMTQQEFTLRTKVEVTADEFWAINEVYNNSALDKDQFCKWWRKANKSRVEQAKAEAKAQKVQEGIFAKTYKLVEKLTCHGTFIYSGFYSRPVTEVLNDNDRQFLDEQGISYRENQWGGYITASDLVFDLKKTLC